MGAFPSCLNGRRWLSGTGVIGGWGTALCVRESSPTHGDEFFWDLDGKLRVCGHVRCSQSRCRCCPEVTDLCTGHRCSGPRCPCPGPSSRGKCLACLFLCRKEMRTSRSWMPGTLSLWSPQAAHLGDRLGARSWVRCCVFAKFCK